MFTPATFFVVLVAGSFVVSRLRHWPLAIGLVEALAAAVALTLVVYGQQIAVSYPLKASLICLSAIVWTRTVDQMIGPGRTRRVAEEV